VVNGGQPHFDVLAAGGGKNPAGMDLLATDRFGALIDALRDSYRVIIVLAAPVDRFADALSVLRHADRTVIAVPAGRGSLRELEDAIDLLAPARIGPEGFVLLQPRSRFAMSRRSRQKGAQGLTQPVTKLRHAASTPR